MTNQEILNVLSEVKKGRYVNLTKMKDLGKGISKISKMVIRLGVNYSNMKINENKETGSLRWGKWVEGLENLVIEHKGNYYLRITSKNPEHPETGADVISTLYLKDGEEISKNEALSIIGEKKMSSKPSSVYCIKFENILELGSSSI